MDPPQICQNCKKLFPSEKINSHSSYCRRNIKQCSKCLQMIDINYQQEHQQQFHTNSKCQYCKKQFDPNIIRNHQKQCNAKPKYCEYCQLSINNQDFQKHQTTCGSRTKVCTKCIKHIMLKDYQIHIIDCPGKIVQKSHIPQQIKTPNEIKPQKYRNQAAIKKSQQKNVYYKDINLQEQVERNKIANKRFIINDQLKNNYQNQEKKIETQSGLYLQNQINKRRDIGVSSKYQHKIINPRSQQRRPQVIYSNPIQNKKKHEIVTSNIKMQQIPINNNVYIQSVQNPSNQIIYKNLSNIPPQNNVKFIISNQRPNEFINNYQNYTNNYIHNYNQKDPNEARNVSIYYGNNQNLFKKQSQKQIIQFKEQKQAQNNKNLYEQERRQIQLKKMQIQQNNQNNKINYQRQQLKKRQYERISQNPKSEVLYTNTSNNINPDLIPMDNSEIQLQKALLQQLSSKNSKRIDLNIPQQFKGIDLSQSMIKDIQMQQDIEQSIKANNNNRNRSDNINFKRR